MHLPIPFLFLDIDRSVGEGMLIPFFIAFMQFFYELMFDKILVNKLSYTQYHCKINTGISKGMIAE
jgi:hypothetical protein